MLTKEQIKALQAPIPAEALKPITGRGGIPLTAIDNYYIIERLNDVFGVGGWGWDVEIIDVCSFQVVVKGTLTIPSTTPNALPTTMSQFGGSNYQPKKREGFDGTDIRTIDKGDLYKGAATNALSKVSSYLGIGGEIYGMKYKSKQKNSNSSSSTQTTSPQASSNKPPKIEVEVGDGVAEARVFELVQKVKKANKGLTKLYGKSKNVLYDSKHKYTLSPNQIKVAKKYGAISD